MSLILVRYCEMGLKSTPIRRRFQSILKNNMLTMLATDNVEAIISYKDARYFIETDHIEKCVKSIKKIFGVASLSVVDECTSDMNDICKTIAEYSVNRILDGESFAVKARREGTHPYTSIDIGREAGSAILEKNKGMNIKVNLTNPDKKFYVEVRDNKAYVFNRYISCPGGLPLGSQGKISAEVYDKRGVVSAWMMMKRGCKLVVHGDYDLNLLKMYDNTLKLCSDSKNTKSKETLGRVVGTSLDNLDIAKISDYSTPTYFPTIGMTDANVDELYRRIQKSDFD
ncbi:MAG: THUMP domain-containing protein [archaeon]|nr:THUMP domain-containing protein [archaeon]